MTDTQPKSEDCRTAVELALWKALKIAREERDEIQKVSVPRWLRRQLEEGAMAS